MVQLHQSTTRAVLRLFRPRLAHQSIQSGDDCRVRLEGFAPGREQRDLLDALSKIALHRCLDWLANILARVLWIQQQP